MSDSEEENFCYFGKPLDPYDQDAFPKKKPISVEEQVATDAQGRRRFHGAFTGGFSAGFYNTVGSLEGWRPSDFKSTRQEKALNRAQRPEDFMDDEDMGEFGIAPQTVRATSDYSTSKKRKKQVFSDGPIPGEPVLHSLLTSGNETIGYLLLKNIGLKARTPREETPSEDRIYGCEMPKTYEISRDADVHQYVIPDIYVEYLKTPKDNSFGLGYVGLDKSRANLFQSAKLVIRDRDQKKVSISGQAFGVGAFEDDDEDIYVKEDMTRYDFELTSEKASKKDGVKKSEKTVFEEFVASKAPLAPKEMFTAPTIPHSFTGKHKQKRSRFEPLPQTPERDVPERKEMNAEIRARYLGEDANKEASQNSTHTTPVPPKKPEEDEKNEEEVVEDDGSTKQFGLFSVGSTDLVFDRFVSASTPEDATNILEVVPKTETLHGTDEMRGAARMKMFGPLTRISSDWQPCSLLCRRFNVPEPHVGELDASKNRKRTKNLIFEYEKFAEVASMDLKPGLWTKENENKVEATDESADKTDEVGVGGSDSTPSKLAQSAETNEADKQTSSEAPKDITDKIDVDKNVDLFRAVFLSSSESEDEEENEKEKTERNTEMKTSVLSDLLIPKIKPLKEGILSNVDFLIFEKPAESGRKDTIEELNMSQTSDDLSYGPALPVSLSKADASTSNRNLKRNDDSDEWIEKSDRKNKSHKKKHKHKKSSHKKKHKHKER